MRINPSLFVSPKSELFKCKTIMIFLIAEANILFFHDMSTHIFFFFFKEMTGVNLMAQPMTEIGLSQEMNLLEKTSGQKDPGLRLHAIQGN